MASDPRYSTHARAERLIAATRAAFAAISLLAIYLDPTEPTKYTPVAYGALAGYVVYAVVMVAVHYRSRTPPPQLPLITHVFDLMVFTVFNYFTEAPNSPFFAYFTFSVVCGALRWRWRGALFTGLMAVLAYVSMGAYAANVLLDPAFELNRFIIRGVYLCVIALMLAFVGAFEERARAEIASLAAWPQTMGASLPATIEELLPAGAAVLRARALALLWEEAEEPWTYVAVWNSGGFALTREPPGRLDPVVLGPAAATDFFCTDLGAEPPTVLYAAPEGLERWTGQPLSPEVRGRLAARSVVGLRLSAESFSGRLLVLDRKGVTSDDLLLGRVVADTMAARMELHYSSRRLEAAAVLEERMRLARDLHDGILQSLTGTALTVRSLDRVLERDPAAAKARLTEVGELLAAEQRELRFFIEELKPAALAREAQGRGLLERLRDMASRLETLWEMRVSVEGHGSLKAAEPLTAQVYPMVQEALVNAAKHAGAKHARAEVNVEDGRLRIRVEDDGHGFPFKGRYDLAELNERHLGPVTLKTRVASLGGDLILESSESGARLEMALPLRKEATHAR